MPTKARPIDRLLASLRLGEPALAAKPAAYRAPMLRSLIHPQWDAGFCAATEQQFRFVGDGWDALLLTETERKAVAQSRETGEWAHC